MIVLKAFEKVLRRHLGRAVAVAALALLGLTGSAGSAEASGCYLNSTDIVVPTDCMYNGGLFYVDGQQPTGTGFVDSFLRVQMKGTEEGFNTDNRQTTTSPAGTSAGICSGTDCDSKIDQAAYTRDLSLTSVPIVTIDGVEYRQFFLDINEASADPKSWITLDQLEIYQSNSASPSTIEHTGTINSGSSGSLTGATKIYDLDGGSTGADNWINLNYLTVSGGSGKADMVAYIPNSLFTQNYVFLYSQFGCVTTSSSAPDYCGTGNSKTNRKYQSGAGFEEWWVLGQNGGGGGGSGQSAVPEPGSLILLGTGLMFGVRKRKQLLDKFR